jgi:hypothetical protein
VPIKNLNGGKTYPKKGRLGSGAYWPRGVPISTNVFGPNNAAPATPTPTAPRIFGTPSNAGNNTQFGQNRVTSGEGATHPNAGCQSIAQQNAVPAAQLDGTTFQMLAPTQKNPVIQPHERNKLPTKKIRGPHYTASGATGVMQSDTAFHPNPPAQAPRNDIHPQTDVLKVSQAKRAPSFFSRNNLWVDPNNSYLGGIANPVNGQTGQGRWSTIKKGAAG